MQYFTFKFSLVQITKILKMNFSAFKDILFSLSFKNHVMTILNAICLFVLFYNAVDMTFDYLNFNYSYKLIVDDNKKGFDLPMISVCTENNILFAKTKVIQYFGVNYFWEMYGMDVKILFEYRGKKSSKKLIQTCTREMQYFFEMLYFGEKSHNWRINYCLNKFFDPFKKFLFDETNFDEMNSLTINSDELFDCSTSIHNKHNTNDPNVTQIDNCFDRLKILTSININKDFGICYTFFDENNDNNSKNYNQINITVKFMVQKDFMIVERPIRREYIVWHSERYFLWYVRLEDHNHRNRETAIELKKVGFEARISVEMTLIKLLSTPYMPFCVSNGEPIQYFSLTLFPFIKS